MSVDTAMPLIGGLKQVVPRTTLWREDVRATDARSSLWPMKIQLNCEDSAAHKYEKQLNALLINSSASDLGAPARECRHRYAVDRCPQTDGAPHNAVKRGRSCHRRGLLFPQWKLSCEASGVHMKNNSTHFYNNATASDCGTPARQCRHRYAADKWP